MQMKSNYMNLETLIYMSCIIHLVMMITTSEILMLLFDIDFVDMSLYVET